jgi:hypothetical protein
MRIVARALALAALLPLMAGRAVCAQESVTLRSDLLLYGDNTEFRNSFREGETIFGAAARVFADLALNPRVAISLGVFGNQRFGSEDAFELVRPVIALTARGRRSAFTFGTLPALSPDAPIGPDRGGPHALLPPLQRETLAFDRPYEAGLQWDFTGASLSHSMWIEWQRLNTAEHRERFDGGVNGRVALPRAFSIPLQIHVVHEGGQLFSTGSVNDSAAAALGVAWRPAAGAAHVSLEAYGLASRHAFDRERPELTMKGRAFLGRVAVERDGWRGHLLMWRGRDFVKDEGDPNYLSLRRDGTRYAGVRDYAETGLARRFTLAPGAVIEVSGRLHRTERHYEYSYRVLSIASIGWKVRR